MTNPSGVIMILRPIQALARHHPQLGALKVLSQAAPASIRSLNTTASLCPKSGLTYSRILASRSLSSFSKDQQEVQRLAEEKFDPSASDDPEYDPNDPTGETAIYEGILSTQIKLVKAFSLTTSFFGLAFQPVLYYHAQSAPQKAGIFLAAGAFFSFFTFATPLLIHHISKKYVTEMYYNKLEDSYTAITYSLLLRKKKLKFKIQDVNVPDIPGMFTTFKAKNVPLFVEGQRFRDPWHFGKIMGYDKPLNLRWENEDKGQSGKER